MFALRAYDVIWAIAHGLRKSLGNFSLEGLAKNILSNNHEGLSGRISFKENRLLESPTFKVVNVIGKSYQELAYWSPITAFLKNLDNHEVMKITTSGDSSSSYARVLLGPVNWPGRLQTVPKGWVYSSEGRPLKIGVPAGNLCPQFVYVNHDQKLNETHITGFSISVFKAVVEHLPYQLPYDFGPFYGSYNQLVEQVYHKIKLKNYDGDLSKLGSAERFLKAVLDIPFAFKRVEAMLYRANMMQK
ncbi:hypothetical protein RIF29_16224 [Crotalaria pallida]|uniref:Receptor ligand binding region domain-containing protein n=1 Tax=Crotalaria pallida TaxID=3830 RepID=A0AAN9FEZ5_CROPI